jgi:hypothetical protein
MVALGHGSCAHPLDVVALSRAKAPRLEAGLSLEAQPKVGRRGYPRTPATEAAARLDGSQAEGLRWQVAEDRHGPINVAGVGRGSPTRGARPDRQSLRTRTAAKLMSHNRLPGLRCADKSH